MKSEKDLMHLIENLREKDPKSDIKVCGNCSKEFREAKISFMSMHKGDYCSFSCALKGPKK